MTCSAAWLAEPAAIDHASDSFLPGLLSRARRIPKSVDGLAELDQQMALLADGDRSAIEPLFRALWPPVHTYCERVLGRGADADDAAQQAMEKVFVEAVRYDRKRRALPWAVTIALWECRTVQRRRQRERTVSLEVAPEVASFSATPEKAAIDGDLLAAASAIFDQLSPSDHEILRLTLEEGGDLPADVSGPTLRKRRERAFTRLRDAWRRVYER